MAITQKLAKSLTGQTAKVIRDDGTIREGTVEFVVDHHSTRTGEAFGPALKIVTGQGRPPVWTLGSIASATASNGSGAKVAAVKSVQKGSVKQTVAPRAASGRKPVKSATKPQRPVKQVAPAKPKTVKCALTGKDLTPPGGTVAIQDGDTGQTWLVDADEYLIGVVIAACVEGPGGEIYTNQMDMIEHWEREQADFERREAEKAKPAAKAPVRKTGTAGRGKVPAKPTGTRRMTAK